MYAALSSDVLERQFGSTELEVLQQDGGGRIICTKAADTGKILELSRVVFRLEGTAAFRAIHNKVLGGASMGKAFQAAGMPFHRDIHASYRYDQRGLPVIFARRFGTAGPPTVIDLVAVVGPDAVPYADILEVYSPDVSWKLTGGEMGQAIAGRLEVFGAELAILDDSA